MSEITDYGGAEVVTGEEEASEVAGEEGLSSPLMKQNDTDDDDPPGATGKASWIPYEGPDGGTGWRDAETDEVLYQDEPPGDLADASELGVDQVGEALSAELGRERAEGIFSAADDESVVRDYAAVALDPGAEMVAGLGTDADYDGMEVVHPGIGRATITDVEGNPAIPMGPSAGYAMTDEGVALTMGGGEFSDPSDLGLPEGAETADLADAMQIRESDEIEPGAWDPSEVDYGWHDETDMSNTVRPGETAPRLDKAQRDGIYAGMREVTRDGTERFVDLQNEAKRASYSPEGQTRERAFLEAAGIDLPYRNDTIHGAEPSDELVAAAAKFTEASRLAFEEIHGDSAEVHRGVSDHAFAQILREAADDGADGIEAETFGMTNYSTGMGVAEKFGRDTAVVSREIEADDVLSYTDALYGGMQEGEISVEGGVQEFDASDVLVPGEGDFETVPLDEALGDPPDAFAEQVRRVLPEDEAEEVLSG